MVSRQCVFQAGILPEGGKPGQSVDGAISKKVMSTGKANFLANLVLFPGMSLQRSRLRLMMMQRTYTVH